MSGEWTRRQALSQAGLAAVGLTGLGLAACSSVTDPSKAGAGGGGAVAATDDPSAGALQHFVSRPDLRPPTAKISRSGLGRDARLTFLNGPWTGPGHGGATIRDAAGELVWFGPNTAPHHRMDFATQTYRGKPVLTWWQGLVNAAGYGLGDCVIADSSYRVTHTIRAHQGLQADLHEFALTPQGTALITVYRPRRADLRSLGGPASGWVISGVAQEIDVATGDLVFEWDSLDHVPVTESHQRFNGGTHRNPYNYFHINSISLASDGDLLISSRNTWTIYKVARPSGRVVWRLGGRKSNFSLGHGARFYWQHHVREHAGTQPGHITLSVFDNGAAPAEERHSRALLLDLDTSAMRAVLKKAYIHPGRRLLAGAMGSAQLLPDGRMFVGWGTTPYFSEFAPDGHLLMDGLLAPGAESYRAFSFDWTGHPADKPAVAARHRSGGGANVYASWNGATEVVSWTVLAGKSARSLSSAGTVGRTGFETAIGVHRAGPYFAVEARNHRGHVLARSAPVRLRPA
jgi:hypothetical protein